MTLKYGYNYSSNFEMNFENVSLNETQVDTIDITVEYYGVTLYVQNGKIIKVRIRTYDMDVTIPTDNIKVHDAIQKVLKEIEEKTKT